MPSEFLIKTSNMAENIVLDIQNIEAQRIDNPIILLCMRKYTYRVPLNEFIKLFQRLASSDIHTVSRWFDLLFKAIHQERKRRKERILTRLAWASLVVVVLPLFIDI